MIVVGLTCNPLDFCIAMKKSRQPYTVNKVNGSKNVVCTSFSEFRKIIPNGKKKRILIFDALEKLKMIQNIVIVKSKSAEESVRRSISENNHTSVFIKNHDYIAETIDKNNDSSISFLHEYNTNLYNITSVALREVVRGLYFDYLHGRITKENFERELNPLYPKRGKSIEAFDNLKALISSNLFKQAQKAIKVSQGKHDREIDKIAKDHGIAAFDLRYFLYTKK